MNIGMLGAGQMGGAMIKGFVNSGKIKADSILVAGGKGQTAQKLKKTIPFKLSENKTDFKDCDIIYLAVQSQLILLVLQDLLPILNEKQIPIVSVSAGVDLSKLLEILGEGYPVVQAIPNTPVEINHGVIGVVYPDTIKKP